MRLTLQILLPLLVLAVCAAAAGVLISLRGKPKVVAPEPFVPVVDVVAAAPTASQPAAAIAEGPAMPVSATMADAEDIAVAERSAAQQPATRTAQRTRRRRASRAA